MRWQISGTFGMCDDYSDKRLANPGNYGIFALSTGH